MQTFTISTFQGVGDTHPREWTTSWQRLCESFKRPKVRQDKDGLLFSPAKYRRPRRLIANVISLSLLVLEVDGGWKCDTCGHRGPLIMFRNARHEGDRCPQCKKRDKKLVTSPVSQIIFDQDALVAEVRSAFGCAFATYSTFSHKQITYSNPVAEPRFRVVIPLTEPVPVAEFSELWQRAVASLRTIPADPQVKDPNRIYYTPVKFCEEAPYEYHIEPGEPLDWRAFVNSKQQPANSQTEQTVQEHRVTDEPMGEPAHSVSGASAPSALSGNQFLTSPSAPPPSRTTGDSVSGGCGETPSAQRNDAASGIATASTGAAFARNAASLFVTHEARHEELCARIRARGNKNSRGNYDARCLAHGGKGTTALLYNPASGAVACNRGCDYEELLIAEGLPDGHLPSKDSPIFRNNAATSPIGSESVGNRQQQSARIGDNGGLTPLCSEPDKSRGQCWTIAPPLITAARLHVIYSLLLAHCLELSPEDADKVQKHWGSPYGELIEWPGTDDKAPVKVCSFPTPQQQLNAVKKLSQEFNLEGLPGIYRLFDQPGPELLSRRATSADYGPWRLNFPTRMRPGALLSPYDNGSGFILGIRIHRNINDRAPFLLTSRGLPGGSLAVGVKKEEASAA